MLAPHGPLSSLLPPPLCWDHSQADGELAKAEAKACFV